MRNWKSNEFYEKITGEQIPSTTPANQPLEDSDLFSQEEESLPATKPRIYWEVEDVEEYNETQGKILKITACIWAVCLTVYWALEGLRRVWVWYTPIKEDINAGIDAAATGLAAWWVLLMVSWALYYVLDDSWKK